MAYTLLLLTSAIQAIFFVICVFAVLSVQRRNYELTVAIRRMEIRMLTLERLSQNERRNDETHSRLG